MIEINNALLREFRAGNRCEWCGRTVAELDPHHYWQKRGVGGGSRLDIRINLIGLCRGFVCGRFVSCHDDAEAGIISREDLLDKVAAREGTTPAAIRDEIQRLRGVRGKVVRRK